MKSNLFARFTLLSAGISVLFSSAVFVLFAVAHYLFLRTPLFNELQETHRSLLQLLDQRTTAIFIVGLGLSILGAMATSVVVLIVVFRSQGEKAARVMDALSSGDLKARLPVTGLRVVDQIILTFNKMADHLEKVISNLKDTQKRKVQLIQELGHDLRTPLTSLRIALENIEYYYDRMSPEQKAFNIETVNYELNYMQRLIEFLFVLSKMNEPDYEVEFQSIDLKKLLSEEIEVRKKSEAGKIKWEFDWEGEPVVIRGSRSLVIRLIRNLLDNGKKFANGTVGIHWKVLSNGRGVLSVYDDGEGMSPEKIVGAGDKDISDVDISDVFKHGKSLGIGTRIIKAIADLHNWRVSLHPMNEQGQGTYINFEMELEREDLTVLVEAA